MTIGNKLKEISDNINLITINSIIKDFNINNILNKIKNQANNGENNYEFSFKIGNLKNEIRYKLVDKCKNIIKELEKENLYFIFYYDYNSKDKTLFFKILIYWDEKIFKHNYNLIDLISISPFGRRIDLIYKTEKE